MALPQHTHVEDVIMKSVMELFKGDAVEFFGIHKKIIGAAATELTQVNLQKNTDDWIYETDEHNYEHFEFQTTYSTKDLYRFMVSDAMLTYKTGKNVHTTVVYSSEIENAVTSLDAGAIQYHTDAVYMIQKDGDSVYADIKRKVENSEALEKKDLMAIVFLPLMKNTVNRVTRIEQSIELSKVIPDDGEQLQIQAMLHLLAEKFARDEEQQKRIGRMINMTRMGQLIQRDRSIEIAERALREGSDIDYIVRITQLDEDTVQELKLKIDMGMNVSEEYDD
jgi:hypothetical protein